MVLAISARNTKYNVLKNMLPMPLPVKDSISGVMPLKPSTMTKPTKATSSTTAKPAPHRNRLVMMLSILFLDCTLII